MNDDTTSRFIASLVKSLQALCHGYVDFEKNIEIIGHIYLNVDSQQKIDYVVNEQVSKADDTSPTTFISNSFHAKPNRKQLRSSKQHDSPLDLKTNSTKDITEFDLSTFHSGSGPGRSASRESSQSLSAGSETGSLSGSVPGRELNPSNQGNHQNHSHGSRRKRHLQNNISSKLSPNVSPPSRSRDPDQRNSHHSPMSRLQYTLGASASKLARRISNELERQGQHTPLASDSDQEIHSRLSGPPAFQSGNHDGSIPGSERFSDNFSRSTDYDAHVESSTMDDGVDLTRVKAEVIDDEHLFEELDWSKANQTAEQNQDNDFPRTGPDDPASEGQEIKSDEQPDEEMAAAASCLYPIMIHQNASHMQIGSYGSPVFPQSFGDPSHSLSTGSSPVASTSGPMSPGSAFASRRARPGGQGQERTLLTYGDLVPTGNNNSALGRLSYSAYREKIKQDNPIKWMHFMNRERERVRKERAILKERDDEEALLKKERIRIQNRLRKRKERHRKREQEVQKRMKTELFDDYMFPGQLCDVGARQPASTRLPSNVSAGQACDATVQQPSNVSAGQPCDATARQPSNVSTGQACDVTARQPSNVSTGQACDATVQQPSNVSTGQPCDATVRQPSNVSTGQPCDVTVPQPSKVSAGQSCDATVRQPSNVSTGQPCDATVPQPSNISAL